MGDAWLLFSHIWPSVAFALALVLAVKFVSFLIKLYSKS